MSMENSPTVELENKIEELEHKIENLRLALVAMILIQKIDLSSFRWYTFFQSKEGQEIEKLLSSTDWHSIVQSDELIKLLKIDTKGSKFNF